MEGALVLVVLYGVGTDISVKVGAGWRINLIVSTGSRSNEPASAGPTPILNHTFSCQNSTQFLSLPREGLWRPGRPAAPSQADGTD
jgi:hypothetical protein